MKLSKETLAIIKNYATINTNLLLKPGNKLSTITAGVSTIMSTVDIVESFDKEFPIYDVNEFLGALSLFNDPNLEFSEKFVTIKEGNSSITYFAASMDGMTVPKKDVVFPEAEIKFLLQASTLGNVLKTASLLKATDMAIVGDGINMSLVVTDKKNKTSNSYSYELGSTSLVFRVNIKIDNLKMLSGDYNVDISTKKISRFVSKDIPSLVYYVAIEADSVFEI
jgi:hypothetical protein